MRVVVPQGPAATAVGTFCSRGSCRCSGRWSCSSSSSRGLAVLELLVRFTYWTLPFPPHWKIGGVFLTGIGALVVGVVLMFIYRAVNPPFFKGETLNKDTPILVPED